MRSYLLSGAVIMVIILGGVYAGETSVLIAARPTSATEVAATELEERGLRLQLGRWDAIDSSNTVAGWLHADRNRDGAILSFKILHPSRDTFTEGATWRTDLDGVDKLRLAHIANGFLGCVLGHRVEQPVGEYNSVNCWRLGSDGQVLDTAPQIPAHDVVSDYLLIPSSDGQAAIWFRNGYPGGPAHVPDVVLVNGELGTMKQKRVPYQTNARVLGFVAVQVLEGYIWAWSTFTMEESNGRWDPREELCLQFLSSDLEGSSAVVCRKAEKVGPKIGIFNWNTELIVRSWNGVECIVAGFALEEVPEEVRDRLSEIPELEGPPGSDGKCSVFHAGVDSAPAG